MNINNVIISGATGAIGTALTSLCLSRGMNILILTRADSKRNDRIPDDPRVKIKVCDYRDLDSVENDTGITWDCFFHFAWAGTAGPGRNDMPLQTGNIRMSLSAVNLAKRFGCKKFVGAGSQAEYGRPYLNMVDDSSTAKALVMIDDRYKLRPDTPTSPEMGYGYAKLCAGRMTRDHAHQLGLEHNWLRILSVYGPNDGESSMINQAISLLKTGESPELTKGEQIWDYVYSKDAAKAFLCVGEKGIDGKTYVLGSGQERPLAEYMKTLRDIISPGTELKLGSRPYGDKQIMYLAADNSELVRDTGYTPDYSFEQGIKDMIR